MPTEVMGCSVLRAKRAGGTCVGTCHKTCHTASFAMSVALTHPPDLLAARSAAQIFGGITGTTNSGHSILHIAAMIDDADLVVFALARGALSAGLDSNGQTPLHIASQRGHLGALEALLRSRDVRNNALVMSRDGETAVHRAAYYGRVSSLRMMVGFLGRDVVLGSPSSLIEDSCAPYTSGSNHEGVLKNDDGEKLDIDGGEDSDIDGGGDSESEDQGIGKRRTPLESAASSTWDNIRTLNYLRELEVTPDLTHEDEWVASVNIEYMRNWANEEGSS